MYFTYASSVRRCAETNRKIPHGGLMLYDKQTQNSYSPQSSIAKEFAKQHDQKYIELSIHGEIIPKQIIISTKPINPRTFEGYYVFIGKTRISHDYYDCNKRKMKSISKLKNSFPIILDRFLSAEKLRRIEHKLSLLRLKMGLSY